MMTPQRIKAACRAELRLDKTGDCWLWRGPLREGYGKTTYREGASVKSLDVHRAMYELHVGPIPEGMQVHHLCGVRACANPAHLEPMTGQKNREIGRVCGDPSCTCSCHVV